MINHISSGFRSALVDCECNFVAPCPGLYLSAPRTQVSAPGSWLLPTHERVLSWSRDTLRVSRVCPHS